MVVRRHRRGISKVEIRRLVLDIPARWRFKPSGFRPLDFGNCSTISKLATMSRGSRAEVSGSNWSTQVRCVCGWGSRGSSMPRTWNAGTVGFFYCISLLNHL
jgi:hypothetical protein